MNPQLAQALAVAGPFLIALLARAEASNKVRGLLGLLLVVGLTVGTYLGDAYPDTFEALVAQAGTLAAILVGTYKAVDAALGEDTDLNEILLPGFGLK